VALHLGAVGTIYVVALVLGDGFAGPTMPPPTVAMASPQAALSAPGPTATSPAAPTFAPTAAPAPLPEWTRRAEVAAPWEPR
jgi:hypothetical protein